MNRILVAGIGNIFQGDDAFGCEVASRLLREVIPPGVRVRDFGIRSYDLAFAIEEGWDAVILVDAMSRGEAPGTVFLMEPSLAEDARAEREAVDAHSMNPMRVLEMVQSLGCRPKRLYVVGCEPAVLEADDLVLSEPVTGAIPHAVAMIHTLIGDLGREETDESPVGSDLPPTP